MIRTVRECYILWATVRPAWCANRLRIAGNSWLKTANKPKRVNVKVAVSFPEHEKELKTLLKDTAEIIMVGENRPGVTYPFYQLTSELHAADDSIVILASDDIMAIPYWDAWVSHHFDEFDGCLLVNDGYQSGSCVTLPILTFSCLLKLNRILYHPAYYRAFSDSELYDVLEEMKLLKNLRLENQPTFEHIHWAGAKRGPDEWDKRVVNFFAADKETYERRKRMSLLEKLKV